MTTQQIESMANREGLATYDFNVGMVLREQVIPMFFLDVDEVVGKVYWRRRQDSLSVTASSSDRDYDLPATFDRMDGDFRMSTTSQNYPPLTYIGEDAEQVNRAEAASGQSRPTGFYFVPSSTDGILAVRFNTYPDAAYTVRYQYYIKIVFTDHTASVDLKEYIPDQFHIVLMHGLRAAIMEDRFGIGDQRAQTERGLYDRVIHRMRHHKEPAPRNHAVFVK